MDFPKKTPEYEDLRTLTEPLTTIYGPSPSRRLGTSLGINLLGSGQKICSFNCPYCELGLTQLKMAQMKKGPFPPLEEVERDLRTRLVELTKNRVKLDYITISGNGEPTMHPLFLEAAVLIKKIRDELTPVTPIACLSNGATLDSNKVIKGLNLLDERMIKLDAGNDEMLSKIDAPLVRITVAKLIQGVKKLSGVILQSLFVQGIVENTTPHEVDEWIEVAGIIKPKAVHIYTLDRVPPTAGLKAVPPQRLKEISQILTKRTGIKATVFS
jgi:wyosine [tRNA(Phe)-imidazoG37] synthetase (radical SAM superfamily)